MENPSTKIERYLHLGDISLQVGMRNMSRQPVSGDSKLLSQEIANTEDIDARRFAVLNIAKDDVNTGIKQQSLVGNNYLSAALANLTMDHHGAKLRKGRQSTEQSQPPFLLGNLVSWLESLVAIPEQTPTTIAPGSWVSDEDESRPVPVSPILKQPTRPVEHPTQSCTAKSYLPHRELDLRENRKTSDFHRLSPSYRPGRYADLSGNGFEDTSGANERGWIDNVVAERETQKFGYCPTSEGDALLQAVKLSDELGHMVPEATRRAAEMEEVLQRRRREEEEDRELARRRTAEMGAPGGSRPMPLADNGGTMSKEKPQRRGMAEEENRGQPKEIFEWLNLPDGIMSGPVDWGWCARSEAT